MGRQNMKHGNKIAHEMLKGLLNYTAHLEMQLMQVEGQQGVGKEGAEADYGRGRWLIQE